MGRTPGNLTGPCARMRTWHAHGHMPVCCLPWCWGRPLASGVPALVVMQCRGHAVWGTCMARRWMSHQPRRTHWRGMRHPSRARTPMTKTPPRSPLVWPRAAMIPPRLTTPMAAAKRTLWQMPSTRYIELPFVLCVGMNSAEMWGPGMGGLGMPLSSPRAEGLQHHHKTPCAGFSKSSSGSPQPGGWV